MMSERYYNRLGDKWQAIAGVSALLAFIMPIGMSIIINSFGGGAWVLTSFGPLLVFLSLMLYGLQRSDYYYDMIFSIRISGESAKSWVTIDPEAD